MYSTKRVNKNLVDNNAYITIGDPYKVIQANPFRQPKPGAKAPLPFQVKMIPQNEEKGNFTKLEYKPSGYNESIKYLTTQPLDSRKRGFGTKDAKRHDEFSNYIRTEQYRETIKKEKNMGKSTAITDALEKLLEAKEQEMMLKTQERLSSGTFSYDDQVHQFDIGRQRNTEFNPKASKDTYYVFQDERDKRFGMSKPVSYDVGADAWNTTYKPPVHGGKSEVKKFRDKSHLNVNGY